MAMRDGKIRIGLFGFGRTGASVAREKIDAPHSELVCVVRKPPSHAGEYASRLPDFRHDECLITGSGRSTRRSLSSIRWT
jgi:4-hydroxy-tetrahydrodipicolinate reductase